MQLIFHIFTATESPCLKAKLKNNYCQSSNVRDEKTEQYYTLFAIVPRIYLKLGLAPKGEQVDAELCLTACASVP